MFLGGRVHSKTLKNTRSQSDRQTDKGEKFAIVLRQIFYLIYEYNKMSKDRGTKWSVTINNPIKADEDNIGLAKSRGWQVIGQLEEGEQGTKHYQLMVKTPQVRFSALKKAFPRAHIEIARNADALEQYVTKEDTRIGSLPENKSYLSLADLWLKFYDYIELLSTIDQYKLESLSEDKWLELFDGCISALITRGYNVETMGVNPQIRGCVKKYGISIYWRSQNIRNDEDRLTVDSQDSQTQEIIIPTLENVENRSETGSRSTQRQQVRWENDESDENSESTETSGRYESGSSYDSSSNVSEEY